MVLGAPRAEYYLHNRRGEMLPVMFINQLLWSILRVLLITLLKLI